MPHSTYITGNHYLNAWLQGGGLATFLFGILVVIIIVRIIRR
jgi:O-antigen ligase